MTLFKEDLFFSGELKAEFEKLRSLQKGTRGNRTAVSAPVFTKRLDMLENLFGLFHKRQILLKAPAPKPFLFSELKKMILAEANVNKDLFPKPRFLFRNDFYLPARIMDLKESLLSLNRSLELATSRRTSWSFSEEGDSLSIRYRFGLGYDMFDLKGFCQKLAWQDTVAASCRAGFPVLEALIENCKGSFKWKYGKNRWKLSVYLPILKTR